MPDNPDNPEVFIRDGEVWIPDGPALRARIGAVYLYVSEGDLWAGVPGVGDDLVRNLLAEPESDDKPRLASVKSIK
jgi:hypothetical protein